MKRFCLLAIVVAGCDGGTPTPPAITPTVFDEATLRTVRGRAIFKGEAPAPKRLRMGGSPECSALWVDGAPDESVVIKDGRVRNVFVHVKEGLNPVWAFAIPKEPVVVANERCLYAPRVVGVRAFQPVRFTNGDATIHNVHGISPLGDFNVVLPDRNATRDVVRDRAEIMLSVRCDLHPWMQGWIGVCTHPFFAVTGDDGGFEIPRLPPGEYVIEAWHERFGTRTAKVTIGAEAPAEVEFVFEK